MAAEIQMSRPCLWKWDRKPGAHPLPTLPARTVHVHTEEAFPTVFLWALWYITPSINADLFTFPDQLHSVPIAQMGNYQDFLKSAPQPLRDADPEQPKRLHTFGNPFKLDKKARRSHPRALC